MSVERPSAGWLRFAPIAAFGVLAGFFAATLLSKGDDALRSALIDRPPPAFELPLLNAPEDQFDQTDLAAPEGANVVTLVNFWASWCVPCLVEHPQLMALAERSDVRLIGVNYKDDPSDARAFLERHGDPFDVLLADENGQGALKWGFTGAPETFVISPAGRIVHKKTGPINPPELDDFEAVVDAARDG